MERVGMIIKFFTWLLALCQPAAVKPAAPYSASAGDVAPAAPSAAAPVAHVAGAVLVPGKELSLGGRMYVIAPLNAAAVKQYRDEIKDVFVGGLPDIGLVAKMALASLQRNYPGMTLEMVEQMIDYQNYFDVWEALLNLSGLVAQAKEMMRRVNEQMETTASTT
jgi:hypothetical protein